MLLYLTLNSPSKTSLDDLLIFYTITHCYIDGDYCQAFSITAGDNMKYQGGDMMQNASVDNHFPLDYIFDFHPRRECNIYTIIPHENVPCITSLDDRLIVYTITCWYYDNRYCCSLFMIMNIMCNI